MRTIKSVWIVFFLLAVFSCTESNKRDRDIDTNETIDTTKDKRAANKAVETKPSALNTEDMNAMYKHLNMTEDQIDQFEKSYNEKLDAVKKSAENMDDATLKNKMLQKKRESLKSILSATQYSKYVAWEKDRLPS